jgi:hypothetical protein
LQAFSSAIKVAAPAAIFRRRSEQPSKPLGLTVSIGASPRTKQTSTQAFR